MNENKQKVFNVFLTIKGKVGIAVLAEDHLQAFAKVQKMDFCDLARHADIEELSYDNLHLGSGDHRDYPYPLSDNQFLFVHDAESQGFLIDFGYSGRGMYGEICPAVIFYPRAGEKFSTDANYCEDSMGMGLVYYARK